MYQGIHYKRLLQTGNKKFFNYKALGAKGLCNISQSQLVQAVLLRVVSFDQSISISSSTFHICMCVSLICFFCRFLDNVHLVTVSWYFLCVWLTHPPLSSLWWFLFYWLWFGPLPQILIYGFITQLIKELCTGACLWILQ